MRTEKFTRLRAFGDGVTPGRTCGDKPLPTTGAGCFVGRVNGRGANRAAA